VNLKTRIERLERSGIGQSYVTVFLEGGETFLIHPERITRLLGEVNQAWNEEVQAVGENYQLVSERLLERIPILQKIMRMTHNTEDGDLLGLVRIMALPPAATPGEARP
jgi:hypothetical protein